MQLLTGNSVAMPSCVLPCRRGKKRNSAFLPGQGLKTRGQGKNWVWSQMWCGDTAEPKSHGRGQVPVGTVPVLTRGQVQNSESELKDSVWQYHFPRESHLPNLCKWKWATKKPCAVLNWGLPKKCQYRSSETWFQRSFNIQGLNNVAIIFITLQNIFYLFFFFIYISYSPDYTYMLGCALSAPLDRNLT